VLELRLDNLDQFVAEAIAAARFADTALAEDIIPYLPTMHRPFAKGVRNLTGPDRLFEVKTLPDLEALIELMERAIANGTIEETVYDNSPENVSCDGWTRRQRDEAAEALSRGLIVILELRDMLHAVQDLLATRRVLERMHAEA